MIRYNMIYIYMCIYRMYHEDLTVSRIHIIICTAYTSLRFTNSKMSNPRAIHSSLHRSNIITVPRVTFCDELDYIMHVQLFRHHIIIIHATRSVVFNNLRHVYLLKIVYPPAPPTSTYCEPDGYGIGIPSS